jgi:hypothetical protein
VGDEDWKQLDPELRFGVRACGVGLTLAYALTFPLKWAGLMPDHISWLGLTVAPAAMLGLFVSLFAGGLWLRNRWWLVFIPFALLSWVLMLGLIFWERG